MFVSTNRIRTRKGFGDCLEEQFTIRGGIEDQPGFLGFELWKDENGLDYDEFLLVTHWESKADFNRWTDSDAFKHSPSYARIDHMASRPQSGGFEVRLMSIPSEEHALLIPNEGLNILQIS